MDKLKTLGVGAVSSVLILFVVVGGYNLLALHLGTVSGDYFKGALAVIVLLGGAWLSMQHLGFIGKPFMLGATIVLLAIAVRHRVPGIADLFVQTTKAADRSASRLAVDLSVAHHVRCDRGTPRLPLFGNEREPLVWLSESVDGRLTCYDRPGPHPQTGLELVPVDERLARRILEQEPPNSKPTPEPVYDVRTVSLPELGQRPIPR